MRQAVAIPEDFGRVSVQHQFEPIKIVGLEGISEYLVYPCHILRLRQGRSGTPDEKIVDDDFLLLHRAPSHSSKLNKFVIAEMLNPQPDAGEYDEQHDSDQRTGWIQQEETQQTEHGGDRVENQDN